MSDTPPPASPAPANDLTSALEEIRERSAAALEFPLSGFAEDSIRCCTQSAMDVPRLLAAVEAVLKEADEWEATSAVRPLQTRRYAAECFRAAVTRSLAGKEESDG